MTRNFEESFSREIQADTHVITAMAEGRSAQEMWGSAPELPPHDPERLKRILDMLPSRHADIWELTSQGVSQSSIARLFGVSQPNISFVMRRIRAAIKLLLSLPEIDEAGIERDLSPYLTPEQVRLLQVHFRTCNYTRTAEILELRPPSVRSWLATTLNRLRKVKARELTPYITVFEAMIGHNGAWGSYKTGHLTTEQRRALGHHLL